ncbi:copper amine oxidase N-terminal domain-containing protein [Desulfoscipio sp. XC116]|uniref:copper amine oxidase N-terminal domain-containing protein n=1 Tax=Desulfoscipio sp. XC116 TaxID=3144975 RepID=UPI00325BE327
MKRKFMVLLMSGFLLLALGGMAEASVASKQIKVQYNNIVIYADGKAVSVSADQEPFLLNGVTYVPLRVAGEALNSTINWQAETKTIQIIGGDTAATNSLKLQLTAKDQEITNLKKQVEDLKYQLDKKDKYDKDDLDGLEDDLLDDYDKLERVAIEDIKLDGDEDDVDVEIEVDLRDYGDEWEDLTDREIEDWLEDLTEYIQDELTEDTVVKGVIIDTHDDEELVKFDKDGDDRLDVDFKDEDYRGDSGNASDVEDELLNDKYDVDNMEFIVSQIKYDKDDDEVTVYLDARDDDCSELWADSNNNTIRNDVEDICRDIAEKFDDEDVKVDNVRAYFFDENDKSLDSYRYDFDIEILY